MDNVTHSLIGYALARSIPVGSGPGQQPRRRAYAWTAVIGSNLPDLDFLIGSFSPNAKLAYLLHHRGHTHTLVFALAAAWPLAWLCARAARYRSGPRAMGDVAAVAVLALLLHIGFDSLNNYGVHPYWPLDNRWRYGDTVFIVEPLLLLTLSPFLAMHGTSRPGRAAGWLIGLAMVAIAWRFDAIRPQHAAALTLVWLLASAAQRMAGFRPGLAWVGCLAVVLGFGVAGRAARAHVERFASTQLQGSTLLAISSHPFPGNPLCWNVMLRTQRGEQVQTRRGHLSLWPRALSPAQCSFRPGEAGTARWDPIDEGYGAALRFTQLRQLALPGLRDLRSRDCQARAYLQFMRLPYLQARGGTTVLGDLRYDFEPQVGWAEEILTEGGGPCPRFPAPWVAPMDAQLRVSDPPPPR